MVFRSEEYVSSFVYRPTKPTMILWGHEHNDVLMAVYGLGETNHKLEPWNRALLSSRNDRTIVKSGE